LVQQSHHCEDGVIIETLFIHESGETISGGKFHVVASKQDPQGYGSAMTYARRYALQAACGIAPEDDDGNRAVSAPKAVEKPSRAIRSKEQVESLVRAATSAELLTTVWKALLPEEREMVRDLAQNSGSNLKMREPNPHQQDGNWWSERLGKLTSSRVAASMNFLKSGKESTERENLDMRLWPSASPTPLPTSM
jgi:hypothetical protein